MALCMADICAWFHLQQGATRLDTVMSLLQMLYPLELQFVGVYLEDLARRDYHCLRDVEQRFNLTDMVARFTDLTDKRCRASLIVALSLLKSNNHATASTVYEILLTFFAVCQNLPTTKDVLDEISLLFTMARYHPAFKFEQKNNLNGLCDEIIDFLHKNRSNEEIGSTTYVNGVDSNVSAGFDDVTQDSGHPAPLDVSILKKKVVRNRQLRLPASLNRRCASTQTTNGGTSAIDAFVVGAQDVDRREPNTLTPALSSAFAGGDAFLAGMGSDERAATAPGSLLVNMSGFDDDVAAVENNDLVSEAKRLKESFTFDKYEVLSSSSTKEDFGTEFALSSPITCSRSRSKDRNHSSSSSERCALSNRPCSSSVDALLLASSNITNEGHFESVSVTVANPKEGAGQSNGVLQATNDVTCRRGGSTSSTEASIRAPATPANCRTLTAAKSKFSVAQMSDFVPRPLFFLLRDENLLRLKKFFAQFQPAELLSPITDSQIEESDGLSPDDKFHAARILDVYRRQMLCDSDAMKTYATKNGFFPHNKNRQTSNNKVRGLLPATTSPPPPPSLQSVNFAQPQLTPAAYPQHLPPPVHYNMQGRPFPFFAAPATVSHFLPPPGSHHQFSFHCPPPTQAHLQQIQSLPPCQCSNNSAGSVMNWCQTCLVKSHQLIE